MCHQPTLISPQTNLGISKSRWPIGTKDGFGLPKIRLIQGVINDSNIHADLAGTNIVSATFGVSWERVSNIEPQVLECKTLTVSLAFQKVKRPG